jgi:UDP-glucose 4-epimerase
VARFIVLGGSGFIGSALTDHLAASGHSVRVVDTRLPAPGARRPRNVEYQEGNLLNDSDLDAAFSDGADTVLHLVSTTVPATSLDNVQVEVEANVLGSVRVLDAMVRHGIRRIGYPSSGGTVYREGASSHREDERCEPTCPYGLGKLLVEELLRYHARHKGIEHQIWRISNPYGDRTKRHRMQGVIDAFLHRVRDGEPLRIWGDGSAARDFIFIDDVATALTACMEKASWNEVYNVGTGIGTSVMDVLHTIEATVGRKVQVEAVPSYVGPSRSVLDPDKLRRATGWSPAFDLAAGISAAWSRLLQAPDQTPTR